MSGATAAVTPITPPFDMEVELKKLGVESENRYWLVEHNPRSSKTPVKVSLMQRAPGVSRSIKSLSTLIGYDSCIATPEAVVETATEIQARAGRIDDVVGMFS